MLLTFVDQLEDVMNMLLILNYKLAEAWNELVNDIMKANNKF